MNKIIKLSFTKAALTAVLACFIAFTASAQTTVTSSTTTMSTGTYQVTEDVTISNRITISGEGTTLTASKGIAVHQGNSLTIEGDGSLNAYNEVYSDAAIGGSKSSPNAGTITINGGNIFAKSYNYSNNNGVQSAAIGGGYFYDYDYANGIDKSIGGNGTIIINGGTIHTLVSFGGAASIGGSKGADGGHITITGGTITAERGGGNTKGAGIGGGDNGNGGTIIISGGTITTKNKSGYGAGIGGGSSANGGNITISGGDITAIGGGSSAGIGGGNGGSAGTITISGGIVKATGQTGSAGIGGSGGSYGGSITISVDKQHRLHRCKLCRNNHYC